MIFQDTANMIILNALNDIPFYSLLVGKKIGCTTFDYCWNLDNWLDAYCWFDFNATFWLWCGSSDTFTNLEFRIYEFF